MLLGEFPFAGVMSVQRSVYDNTVQDIAQTRSQSLRLIPRALLNAEFVHRIGMRRQTEFRSVYGRNAISAIFFEVGVLIERLYGKLMQFLK